MLLNMIGNEAYDVVRDLSDPVLPKKNMSECYASNNELTADSKFIDQKKERLRDKLLTCMHKEKVQKRLGEEVHLTGEFDAEVSFKPCFKNEQGSIAKKKDVMDRDADQQKKENIRDKN